MNTRILIAAAWLVSLVAVYFIGSGGAAKPASENGAQAPGAASSGGVASSPDGSAASKPGRARAFGDPDELMLGGKRNVAAIVSKARAEMAGGMRGMMNMRGILKAIAPLADLDPSQLQEALAEVEKTVKEPEGKMMFYSLLLGQWAETDGKAALEYANAKLEKNPMFEMGVRSAIIGTWARSNPAAAWQWFEGEKQNLSGDRNSSFVISTLFSGMAAAGELDLALTRMATLDDEQRMMAINGIASGAGTTTARQQLLERTASLPADQKSAFRQGVMSQWMMTDSEGALKWIRALPVEEQRPLRENAAQSLLWMNPAKGAEIMMENADPKDLPKLYDRVVGPWAQSDLRGAGEWLAKQPQGPELDSARMTYASVAARKDPAAAMDWARSVTEPEKRVSSVVQVYSQWRAKDAKAADAGLAGAGLPAEDVQKVREQAEAMLRPKEAAPPITTDEQVAPATRVK